MHLGSIDLDEAMRIGWVRYDDVVGNESGGWMRFGSINIAKEVTKPMNKVWN